MYCLENRFGSLEGYFQTFQKISRHATMASLLLAPAFVFHNFSIDVKASFELREILLSTRGAALPKPPCLL